MATRLSAAAAAIGLVSGVLGVARAGAATPAGATSASAPAHPIPFSVAGPHAAPRPVAPDAPDAPATPTTPPAKPDAEHATPKTAKLPFHMTGKKARSLPDTGVPMSAALGAVTALTALLAGIGTVLAARRRTDHEA